MPSRRPAPAAPREVGTFTTILPVFVDPGLETELIARKVDIRATPIQTETNPILSLLFSFGPALLITETCFDTAGIPVIYAIDYHRGSHFTFSLART